MHNLSAIAPEARQAPSLRSVGATLDKWDTANSVAWEAREYAWYEFEPHEVVRATGDAWAATVRPLKEARNAYFALARQREARRSVPRLPAGIDDNARAVVQAARERYRDLRDQYIDFLDADGSTYRERADCAAAMERARQIAETLIEKFNKRVDADADAMLERLQAPQTRAYNWQMIEASRKRGVIVRRQWERNAS